MTKAKNEYRIPYTDRRWLSTLDRELEQFSTEAAQSFSHDPDGKDRIELIAYLARVVLMSYADGQITFQDGLKFLAAFVRIGPLPVQIKILGLVAYLALRIEPKHLGTSKAAIPRFLRKLAGELVQRAMKEDDLTQIEASEQVLKRLVEHQLTDFLAKPPTVETVQKWHREWKISEGLPSRPGRPSKKPA